jgi:hypothetical protein
MKSQVGSGKPNLIKSGDKVYLHLLCFSFLIHDNTEQEMRIGYGEMKGVS